MVTKKKKQSGVASPKTGARKKTAAKQKVKAAVSKARKTDSPPSNKKLIIVGIGASAGGLEAFEAFFNAMPPDSNMAFVVIAHLDPTHVSILPELIQKKTKLSVSAIKDGTVVKPNSVYVIPPNKDISILNGTLQLLEPPKPRGFNLPIDTFFRALANDQGSNAVCVILSGTGTDGTIGLRAIKSEGGMAMVQDEKSSKYDGMPRSAMATNLVDFILPPAKMPEQLISYMKHVLKGKPLELPADTERIPNALQKIYILLRSRTGHDFSNYKINTICRRVERRMHIHQIDNISDYVRYVSDSERETTILFKELLIGVTNFFRDPKAFEVLQNKVMPELLSKKPDNYTLRVWVPGCSTGEEAYSIAILLEECRKHINHHFNVQIFGTDIDEEAVKTARAGLYPNSIGADVNPERLQRYFHKEDENYRIKKTIREKLIFASQNLLKDPPFTKLDLISCRNLLIYLDQEAQRRVLSIFHYSLKPGGILFLGSSETIGQATNFFTSVERKWKIYKQKSISPKDDQKVLGLSMPAPVHHTEITGLQPESINKIEALSAHQLVESILQESDMPPCVIIDDANNIIYVHGRTGKFLEPAAGKVSVNVIEMARQGFKVELANAIRRVAVSNKEFIYSGLQVPRNGDYVYLDLIVRPILAESGLNGLKMVIFEETSQPSKTVKVKAKRPKVSKKSMKEEKLELELQYTRENLQTTIEELETSNEELKSTNEELQSTNEELQSTNEELETSKEELQSLNEETVTVNVELQSRIDELSKVNDDLKNLLDSIEIAAIFLDIDLNIRRFTPTATTIIHLELIDVGRPLEHFAINLIDVNLTKDAAKVLKDLAILEREVKSKDGEVYRMRLRPYRTINNVIDGVVITFEDISAQKKVADALVKSNRDLERMVQKGILDLAKADKEFKGEIAEQKKIEKLLKMKKKKA